VALWADCPYRLACEPAGETEEGMNPAEHHQQQIELQQQITEALDRAAEHQATRDDIRLLAWASGVKYQLKETTWQT